MAAAECGNMYAGEQSIIQALQLPSCTVRRLWVLLLILLLWSSWAYQRPQSAAT